MDDTANWRIALLLLGGAAIVLAALGLSYNAKSLLHVIRNSRRDPETPYFAAAYLTMSVLCVACYVLLLVSGIQFIRGDTRLVNLFTGVPVFEIVYFLSIGALWVVLQRWPKVGMSVAAATGVAGGGLMPQFIVLFPL